MIGSHHNQGIALFFSECQRTLYGFVQIDRFTNLPAWVGGVILFIDGCAFNLQEEAFFILTQQLNRFVRHLRQRRHGIIALRVCLAGHRRLFKVAVIRGFRAFPANRHVAVGEQAQQRLILICRRYRLQRSGIVHQLISPRQRLLTQRFPLPFACGRHFSKGGRAAAKRDVRPRIQQLLGDRPFSTLLQRVCRAKSAGKAGAVAFA